MTKVDVKVAELDKERKLTKGMAALWQTEDWWAVWMAFLVIVVAALAYFSGSSLAPLAVYPAPWSLLSDMTSHLWATLGGYVANFVFWLVVFTTSSAVLGFRPQEFAPSFALVYLLSVLVAIVSSNVTARDYNIEAPLLALLVGLAIGNLAGLPHWMRAGVRVEYYIKTGIVLLGATLPFTLILYAGPVAFGQATIIALATFLTIFFTATRVLQMDRRFAAVLGAGGAVCGVSASIAMAAAVGAKKEHVSMAITTVVAWAIIMIFVLPFAAKALDLHPGIAGAWIGTSEFADAAGLAAAQQYGLMYESAHPEFADDSQEVAIRTYTLMKVIGRDIWIGLWAFVMAFIAVTRWEVSPTGEKPNPTEIWRRFPKFVLGFFVASALITLLTTSVPMDVYLRQVEPLLIGPIKTMRTWTFIFTFLCIGITTRFRDLSAIGSKPWVAFSCGVVVNIILGFLLAVVLLGEYWASIRG
jgi:uncharacterized integral membrane protein (TIGR00698 family)